MGYRSEVIIVLSPEVHQLCIKEGNLPAILEDADSCLVEAERVVWVYDWVKWYESYPEVQEAEIWLNWLGDQDLEFGAIILGEGDDDMTVYGSPYDFGVNYTRTLSFL